MKRNTTQVKALLLLTVLTLLVTGCMKASHGVINEVETKLNKTYAHRIKLVPQNGTREHRYWCNEYLRSETAGGTTVIILKDCSPHGGSFTFTWENMEPDFYVTNNHPEDMK